jgi:hypothetical protein
VCGVHGLDGQPGSGGLCFCAHWILRIILIDASNEGCKMKTDSELPASVLPSDKPLKRRLLGWPSTRPGWWSVGLAAAFVVLFFINVAVITSTLEEVYRQTILPYFVIFMLSCGFSAGIVGLIAVLRRHERSWLVWLAILTGLFVLILILGELLQIE